MEDGAILYGDVDWPQPVDVLIKALRAAGLSVSQGRYSITFLDCEHFKLESTAGDLGPPRIDADASSVQRMLADARLVSAGLQKAGVRHSFEIYDDQDQLVEVIPGPAHSG